VIAMLTRICLALTFAGYLAAQQTAAPTNEPVGAARGDNVGTYNVTQSFELGYRWRRAGGDPGMYRSVVNFGNGLRLLGSSLTVNSTLGHGRFFDEMVLNTSGLGNDPYQSAMLRIQKNRLYRYDMLWRLDEYYSPGLVTAAGAHLADTSRRLQDHDLTLLPQSSVQFRLGYSRNTENGPGLSTAQEFDVNGPGLAVFRDVRRAWNEYRAGTSLDLAGFKFTLLHRWDYFKDDTPYSSAGLVTSGSETDPTALQQFRRSEPVHGANPGWLGNLLTERKHWRANARITYVSGRRDFVEDELASGIGRTGSAATRRILVTGNARRPMLAADLNLGFQPSSRLSIANNTSITNNRIDGLSSFSELLTGIDFGTTVSFRYLGIRTVANSTDLNYRWNARVNLYGGYRFSDRRIRTVEASNLAGIPDSDSRAVYEVSNTLHSGRAGVRLRPWKPFTVNLEAEIGRADKPIMPVSDRNYHALNGRADYRTRKLQLSASYRQVYNVNSPFSISSYSSHARTYSGNASWAVRDGISFDAGYSKLHLDTLSSLAFFAVSGGPPQLQTGYESIYLTNTHAGNFGAHFSVRRRVDLFAGYSITRDAGGAAASPGASDPILTLLTAVRSYPLTYHSPLVRVSIRITPKLRWNAAWQFYSYAEDTHLFGIDQNFRAHTGYTSLLWAF
jgi:hypothetical protein